MARRIHLAGPLSVEELGRQYRQAREPVERSRWRIPWLLGQGQTAQQVAAVTGYSAYWVGQIAQRYNQQGLAGVSNRWYQARGRARTVSVTVAEELRQALATGMPEGSDGDAWTGRSVAEWLSRRLGRTVSYHLGWRTWRTLRRLGLRRYAPRPRHVKTASPAEQEGFKRGYAL